MAVTNSIRAYNSLILLVDQSPLIDGVSAGVDSIAIASDGSIYFKTGIGNLDWTLFSSPSPSGGQAVVEYRTLDLAEVTSKSLLLTYIPNNAALVELDVISGGPQNYVTDYTVSGQTLSWDGTDLSSLLGVGDRLRISYYK